MICAHCEKEVPKLHHIHDDGFCSCDERACEHCVERMAEQQEEASLSDYYGGAGPLSLDEQHAAAWRMKQGLR